MKTVVRVGSYLWYQWRRLCINYPEHAYTGSLLVLAFPFMVYRCNYEHKNPQVAIKAYKEYYTVFRPDDPRSYRIRCSPDLPPGDPHFLKMPNY